MKIIPYISLILALAALASPAHAGEPMTFAISEGNVKQVLQVRAHGTHRVGFTLSMESRCKRTVSGIAIGHGGDAEIDEDEDGLAYAAEEFAYKGQGGLELWIRVDVEKHVHARVKVVDPRSKCPFSEALMKRVSSGAARQ